MCQPSSMKDQVKLPKEDDVPPNFLAKRWVGFYHAVPRINFPFTELDISISLCSAVFLTVVRYTILFLMRTQLDWPKDDILTVGSLAAIVHSLILVPGLGVALTSQPYQPTAHISTYPQWWQDLVDALLQFCTGYMVYDTCTSYLISKGPLNLQGADFLFVGHHIVTTVYMTQCRVLQAGHTSAMICMFWGEFSNPFQNGTYTLSKAMQLPCCNGAFTQQLHSVIQFFFALTYFGIRAIIAPVYFAHVTYCLLFANTRTNIPLVTRIFWIVMIWGVEAGSYAWIVNCFYMLQSYVGMTPAGEFTNEL
ncbi:expressed unknown protein [Seminavis robusta]|uniref:TLC domain-containing protein n=1 Tax=Seminavis robusta TaxID=568900 RepID=A0A9N8DSN0_9STRA|nr:expressed unknown protein [Seminavis robusta]|eukprot:Sro326_g118160.1 n/a (307) ;mRNA; f:49360-50430